MLLTIDEVKKDSRTKVFPMIRHQSLDNVTLLLKKKRMDNGELFAPESRYTLGCEAVFHSGHRNEADNSAWNTPVAHLLEMPDFEGAADVEIDLGSDTDSDVDISEEAPPNLSPTSECGPTSRAIPIAQRFQFPHVEEFSEDNPHDSAKLAMLKESPPPRMLYRAQRQKSLV